MLLISLLSVYATVLIALGLTFTVTFSSLSWTFEDVFWFAVFFVLWPVVLLMLVVASVLPPHKFAKATDTTRTL